MKILIVGIEKNKYQVQRLIEEGKVRGHVVHEARRDTIVIEASHDNFSCFADGKNLSGYDIIYLANFRKRLEHAFIRRSEWVVAARFLTKTGHTQIINQFVTDNTLIFEQSFNYLLQFQHSILFPQSTIVISLNEFQTAMKKYSFPLIVKSNSSNKKKLVFLVENEEEALVSAQNISSFNTSIILREYIPNDGDYRVFTLGYKAIAVFKRMFKEGESWHMVGKREKERVVDKELLQKIVPLAEKISRMLAIEIAGVDIVIHQTTGIPYILEINPGPEIRVIEQVTGKNIAKEIICYFEKKYERNSR